MFTSTLNRRSFLRKSSLAGLAVLSSSAAGCDIRDILSGGESLSGTILSFPPDPDGEAQAIEDVTVSLVGTEHTSSTDADGTFALKDVKPGAYDLRLKKSGYLTFTGNIEVPEGGRKLGKLRYPQSRENVPIQSATSLAESEFQERLSDRSAFQSAVSEVEGEDGIRFTGALALELKDGRTDLMANYKDEAEERHVQVVNIPNLPRTPIRGELSRKAGLEIRNAKGQLMMRLSGDRLGKLTVGVGFSTIASVDAPWASTQSRRHVIPKSHGGREWSDFHAKEFNDRLRRKMKKNNMFEKIEKFLAVSSIEGIGGIVALLLEGGIGAVIGALTVLAHFLYNFYDLVVDILEIACETVKEYYCVLVQRNENGNLKAPFEKWKKSWLKAREAIWNCIKDGYIRGEVSGNPHEGDDFGWSGANLSC